MLTIAITAATPITMPSIVSAERSLLRRSARSAVRSVIAASFMRPSRARWASCGLPARDGGRLRDVGDDLPVAHGDDARGEAGDVRLVRHEDHRHPALAVQALEERDDLEARRGVEVAGRLVGEEQRRAPDERARDRDALLLAARELARQVALAVAEPDLAERGARALALLGRGDAPVDERQLDVLERARPRDQVEALEDEPDLAVAERRRARRGPALRRRARRAGRCRASAGRGSRGD